MKKVLLSLLLLVFMAPFAMRADEVVIGQGTGSDYNTPFNVFYKISWHESIYPASSFDMPCVINSVAYHCATTDVTYPTTEINIYMGMTQRNSIESTTDWTPMEDLTLVYSGSDIVLGDEEWESFTLDTPFEYSRNGNLVIVVAKAADGWTSSLKYFNTDSEDGSNVAMYRQSDTNASYMEHPGTATGTRIKKVADVKLGTSPAQPGGVMVTPSEIALGVRPNGAWMRPTSFEIAATSGYANVNVLESTNSFFVLEDVELPLIILGGEPKTIEVTTGEAPAGEINANIVVAYAEGRGTELVNISATAYDPVCPDVWEMAQEVSSYPYSDTPDYASLYDNYQLPGEGEDGADAVYELTFEEDVMLTVEVTGENHKQALYQEGFNGVGGPSVDNNYFGIVIPEMPEIGEGSQFEYGFETGLEGWTTIDDNADGHVWYHNSQAGDHGVLTGDSHTGTGHLMSESYCNAAWLSIEPDDYIIAPEKAVLAVGSTFKFYASAQDENYAAEHFGVAISTNGNTSASDFTTIAEWTLSAKGGQKAARNANGVRQGAWYEYTVDLSAYAGQEAWIAIRHFGCADQFILLVDDASLSIGMKRDEAISYEINNMVVPAGTYYLATSATEPFSVNINAETMPAPEKATEPYPANYAQNVGTPSLAWQFGAYTVEYQVLLGTTYPPTDVIIDWTNDLQIGHSISGLYNNKNYFWQVNVRNTTGTTYGDVWSFTTKLNVPSNVTAVEPEIYVGDDAVINWTAVQDRSYRGYNVYVDGVKNNTSLVTATTYTVSGLEYDMEGYEIAVTAVYDEGESQLSTPAMVYVSGEGAIEGYVFDQDGVTPIAAANVEVKGKDEFNRNQTYTFTTDENGLYSGAVLAGTYKVTASEANYQTTAVEDIVVAYAETTTGVNLSMTEVYTPVYQVIAEEVDPSIVKVYWSWSEIIPDALIDDFETG
ncbi:MAG: hypothetical protein E7066_05880, partial [Lentimicrobiaceae bacterium]|nr:hypothetical protein [Lentimicrobiaceae bacterium]